MPVRLSNNTALRLELVLHGRPNVPIEGNQERQANLGGVEVPQEIRGFENDDLLFDTYVLQGDSRGASFVNGRTYKFSLDGERVHMERRKGNNEQNQRLTGTGFYYQLRQENPHEQN